MANLVSVQLFDFLKLSNGPFYHFSSIRTNLNLKGILAKNDSSRLIFSLECS